MNKKNTKLNKTKDKLKNLTENTKEMKEIVAKRNIQLDSLINKVKGILEDG